MSLGLETDLKKANRRDKRNMVGLSAIQVTWCAGISGCKQVLQFTGVGKADFTGPLSAGISGAASMGVKHACVHCVVL